MVMRAFPAVAPVAPQHYRASAKLHKVSAGLSLEHSRPPRVTGALGHGHGDVARARKEAAMNSIIYLVGLLVIVMAILSLLGLR
jgi:hypothetical protein